MNAQDATLRHVTRHFLNVLKCLGNELTIPLEGVGGRYIDPTKSARGLSCCPSGRCPEQQKSFA
jgi:hypothetical protein